MELKQLYENVNENNYIIDGNYVYFYGYKRMPSSGRLELLCRVEIKSEKRYMTIKQDKTTFLSSEDLMQDYISRKQNGVRGYKGVKIGYVENYFFYDFIEYDVVCNNGKHHWWRDNQREVNINVEKDIINYIDTLTSDFIKVA